MPKCDVSTYPVADSCLCALHFTGLQYGDYVSNRASSTATPLSSTSDDEEEEEEDEEAGLLLASPRVFPFPSHPLP